MHPLDAPSPKPKYPPRRIAWWLIAVLFLVALLSYTDRLVLSVLVDPLRRSLGISDAGVSLLQGAAFTIVYVFASLPLGRMADHGRRKRLLIAGALLWCSATVLCGLATGFGTLFAGRLLIGIGEATVVPTAVSMIADSFPPARLGTALGTFAMGTVIGGPLGISVGGVLLSAATHGTFRTWPLIGALEPWRVVLVDLGCVGLLAPLLLLTTPEPERRRSAHESDLREMVRHFVHDRRRLLPLYLGMALLATGDYGLLSWAPTTLSREFGWPADRVGLAFGILTAVTGVIGSIGGGWISDFAHRRGGLSARLAICLAAAPIAALAAAAISAPSVHLVLAGIGLWVLASTTAGVGAVSALQELVPAQHRATSMSLVTFCNTLIGLGCGPTLIALTTQYAFGSGAAVGFATSTIIVPAGLLACFLFALSRRGMPAAIVSA